MGLSNPFKHLKEYYLFTFFCCTPLLLLLVKGEGVKGERAKARALQACVKWRALYTILDARKKLKKFSKHQDFFWGEGQNKIIFFFKTAAQFFRGTQHLHTSNKFCIFTKN
tara:strand:- start:6326 stop:6658 length:333 start_codon:yes stop_codon:yes gene_type:complete